VQSILVSDDLGAQVLAHAEHHALDERHGILCDRHHDLFHGSPATVTVAFIFGHWPSSSIGSSCSAKL
jgi:hypothetical protein